jgi:hypothetical protein
MADGLDGQPFPALLPPATYDLAASPGAHPLEESVRPLPLAPFGLIGQ